MASLTFFYRFMDLHHNLGLLFTSRQAFRGRGGEHDVCHEGDATWTWRLSPSSSLLVIRASRLRGLEARAFPAGVRLSFQATFIRQPSLR